MSAEPAADTEVPVSETTIHHHEGAEHQQQQPKKKKMQVPPAFVKGVTVLVPQAQRDQMDQEYLKSLPGILKVVTALLLFCTFCAGINTGNYERALVVNAGAATRITSRYSTYYYHSDTPLWTAVGCGTGMLVVPALLLFRLLFPHLVVDQRNRDAALIVEFVYYAAGLLWFFIQLWLMLAACIRESSAAAIFGFIFTIGLVALYALEAFQKFAAWRKVTRVQGAHVQHLP